MAETLLAGALLLAGPPRPLTGEGGLALPAAGVAGGVAAAVLLVRGRATRQTAIAFGPFLLAGAWAGVLAAGTVALG